MPVDTVVEFDKYYNTDCPHCLAEYGHFVFCPLINRASAEAHSALKGHPKPGDIIAAHALGISLESRN